MSIRVLLVDDNAIIRQALRRLLAKESFIDPIDEAADGEDAVAKVRENTPDVVIMDYDMPDYDGIYGTREILKIRPDLPVILFSMFIDSRHIFEGINSGARGYINKMSSTRDLVEAIKAVYEGSTWFRGEVAEIVAAGQK